MFVICLHTINNPEVIAVARDDDEIHAKIQDYLGYHVDLQMGFPMRNPITNKMERNVSSSKAGAAYRMKDCEYFTIVEVE